MLHHYPHLKEYFTPLHHFGPVQRADNGDVLTYQIGNLKDPFDIPGTVDLKRECPELGLDIVTTPRNAILHIAETLKMYAKNVAEWMFIRKINNVNTKDLFKMDLDQLHEFLCKTVGFVI